MKLIICLLNLAICLPGIAAVAYDRINVTSSPYNAVPNDGIDDTAAINLAISPGLNPTRSIYFPPGTYNYTGLMTLPANKSYRLYGDGPGVSTILFSTNPGIRPRVSTPQTWGLPVLTSMALPLRLTLMLAEPR